MAGSNANPSAIENLIKTTAKETETNLAAKIDLLIESLKTRTEENTANIAEIQGNLRARDSDQFRSHLRQRKLWMTTHQNWADNRSNILMVVAKMPPASGDTVVTPPTIDNVKGFLNSNFAASMGNIYVENRGKSGLTIQVTFSGPPIAARALMMQCLRLNPVFQATIHGYITLETAFAVRKVEKRVKAMFREIRSTPGLESAKLRTEGVKLLAVFNGRKIHLGPIYLFPSLQPGIQAISHDLVDFLENLPDPFPITKTGHLFESFARASFAEAFPNCSIPDLSPDSLSPEMMEF